MNRIDQYLFSNIVKMSYEADKASKMWLKEYSMRSEKERRGYTYFSSKTRVLINDDDELNIFNLWYKLSDKNREDWINKANLIEDLFRDVETFLRMFQHNR